MKTFSLLALLALVALPLSAQQDSASAPPISVFLDCQSFDTFEACDFDFHRTEISLVNWVRDRQVADVHILVTTQSTGAGGTEFTVAFIGLRQFSGMSDTLEFVSPPATSGDDKRRGIARVFRLGLVRFLARTPAAERLSVTMTAPSGGSQQTRPENDRWNAWVFQTSLDMFSQGEETFGFMNLRGRLNADRVTERWKTRVNVNESYTQNRFEIDDTTDVVTIQRSYGGSVLQAKSLGSHWSAGFRMEGHSSTYDNFLRVLSLFPAVEYNIFPYGESTRRQLRIEYNVGYSHYAYRDTTIRDKLKEGMPIHRLRVAGAVRQQWGSVDVEAQAVNYLNEMSMYRVGIFSDVSLRLFKGFSLNVFGNYDIIEDQFYLAKKDFTPAEILTRQFQLGTSYRFFVGVGLSYTFGSIYNNVVNPRFGGGF